MGVYVLVRVCVCLCGTKFGTSYFYDIAHVYH